MPITDLDRAFIREALTAQSKSHDPDRQVGAAISSSNGRLISVGSNSPPIPLGYSIEQSHEAIKNDPRWKYFFLEHAERNAINQAYRGGNSLSGATIYVTLFPCADCARAISSAGIERMVVQRRESPSTRDDKWLEHYEYARGILDASGVSIDEF